MIPKIEGVCAKQYLRDVEDNGDELVIVGNHPLRRRDISRFVDEYGAYTYAMSDFMSINNSGHGQAMYDYCATLHSHECGKPEHNFPHYNIHPSTTVIGYRTGCESQRVDHTVDAEPLGMTSAGFAVVVGLVLGYKRIYLCGVRMEPGTIWYDEHVRANWELWSPIFKPHLTVIGDSWVADLINGGE